VGTATDVDGFGCASIPPVPHAHLHYQHMHLRKLRYCWIPQDRCTSHTCRCCCDGHTTCVNPAPVAGIPAKSCDLAPCLDSLPPCYLGKAQRTCCCPGARAAIRHAATLALPHGSPCWQKETPSCSHTPTPATSWRHHSSPEGIQAASSMAADRVELLLMPAPCPTAAASHTEVCAAAVVPNMAHVWLHAPP
jgi:hypothetical protein